MEYAWYGRSFAAEENAPVVLGWVLGFAAVFAVTRFVAVRPVLS